MKKFAEFLAYGIVTPFIYFAYAFVAVLFTFLFGLPIAIGIHLIQMATNILLNS